MHNTREKLIEQKVKIGKESICHKCIHNGICIGETNQPCIGCNRFIDSNGVTVAYNLSPTEPMTNCQQWIPVSDRLPQNYISVLVYLPGERPLTTVHEAYIGGDGEWHSSSIYGLENEDVTHWMPLPEPPKGE